MPGAATAASTLSASPGRNGRLQASTGINGTAGRLTSPGGAFWLTVQTDGNLVLYRGDCAGSPNAGCAVWTTRTSRDAGDYFLAVQDDGNLVLYRGRVPADAPSGAESTANAGWDTHTSRQRGSYHLSVEDDGNVVLWAGSGPGDRGGVVWSIRPVAASSAAPVAVTAAPVNLNGSWQNNLLHIWQEGDQVLVTASWKRPNGDWVIWRAEGRFTGRTMSLPVRYSSMTRGGPGNYRGEFAISADGNTINAQYLLDGRVVDRQVYQRDR
jgi:hypothetical protein